MKNAIILHGGPSRQEYYDPAAPSMSNAHWIPWLQAALLKADIPTATPEVPRSFERIWDVWKREVERFDIGRQTILVGHSTGAGFFIKYLSLQLHLRVDKVILVAPWLDPDGELATDMFTGFSPDPALAQRTAGITIFNSDNDEKSVQKTTRILRDTISDISYREFHRYGHFCIGDMKTSEFPELLAEILGG